MNLPPCTKPTHFVQIEAVNFALLRRMLAFVAKRRHEVLKRYPDPPVGGEG